MSHTPESSFLVAFSLLNARLTKRMDQYLGAAGISYSEYLILHCLSEAPNQTLSRIQLAESAGFSASGITRLLAPMEKIGMVKKESHPRDARMSLVKLAKGGERLYKDGTGYLVSVASAVTKNLKAEQVKTLLQYSEQLTT